MLVIAWPLSGAWCSSGGIVTASTLATLLDCHGGQLEV
jgi:hypothetical protein